MSSDIRSFSQIEKLIKENPRSADAQAFEWQQFLKTNARSSPELYSMKNSEEFYRWASEHPEKNINTSVWVGKEISETYYYLRRRHEDYQMNRDGVVDKSKIPGYLAAVPTLAATFLIKPRIMEEDRHYQKIEEGLKKEWLKNNNAKDFSSKEGLDYLYGSDDKTKPSLGKEAEKVFRNNPKFKQRVERYDKEKKKIYKKPDDDPRILAVRNKIQEEVRARTELFEKKSKNSSQLNLSKEEIEKYKKEIALNATKKHWKDFDQNNPEKNKSYYNMVSAPQKNQDQEDNDQNPLNKVKDTYDQAKDAYDKAKEMSEEGPEEPGDYEEEFEEEEEFEGEGEGPEGDEEFEDEEEFEEEEEFEDEDFEDEGFEGDEVEENIDEELNEQGFDEGLDGPGEEFGEAGGEVGEVSSGAGELSETSVGLEGAGTGLEGAEVAGAGLEGAGVVAGGEAAAGGAAAGGAAAGGAATAGGAAAGGTAVAATPVGWIIIAVIAAIALIFIIVFLIVFLKGKHKYSQQAAATPTPVVTTAPAGP